MGRTDLTNYSRQGWLGAVSAVSKRLGAKLLLQQARKVGRCFIASNLCGAPAPLERPTVKLNCLQFTASYCIFASTCTDLLLKLEPFLGEAKSARKSCKVRLAGEPSLREKEPKICLVAPAALPASPGCTTFHKHHGLKKPSNPVANGLKP